MAFPDAAWPLGEGDDDLDVDIYSSEKGSVSWDIHKFLVKCSEGERKKLKSGSFAFGGAKWNFFSKFDKRKVHSLFGINIRGVTPSDSVLHCYCDIKFESAMETKNIIFKFICESADSHCSVEDFLSDLELKTFLQDGWQIECDISIKKLKKNDFRRSFAASPFPESSYSFAFYPKPVADSAMAFQDYPKAIPDFTWPCGGDDLKESVYTPEEGCVIWKIKSFLSGCLPGKKELRSGFFFGIWNLFASFDEINNHSLFGLSIRKLRYSDSDLDCYCTITFKDEDMLKTMKHIVFKFKVESVKSQCTVEDFLSSEELSDFLERGAYIVCRFSTKKSSVKEVCSAGTADISNSSRRNTFKAHTKSQLQDSYSASAPQSHSRWNTSSLRRLHEESDALLRRSRYNIDPLLGGYVEPLHYFSGFFSPGIAGQMPGVPGGDNRDPLGRNGGPGGRDEFQGNHKDDEELPLVSSKVFNDFKNLLRSGKGADVTLQVQDQQFKAHRIIITARSSVFESMINDMQENISGVVKVEDCDPSSFPILLEFLYCGGTEQLSLENVFSLYKSADKYEIQDLKMRCLQFIKHNLSVKTFCEALRISFEHPETNLLQVATEFFIRHFKQISSTSEWETFLSENPVKGNKLFMEIAKLKFQ